MLLFENFISAFKTLSFCCELQKRTHKPPGLRLGEAYFEKAKTNSEDILTDEITKAWSGMTTRQYKNLKGLKKENLRDNMTTLELVLNMLAEATTTEISKEKNPQTFAENRSVAREGGEVAGNARKDIEERTSRPVTTSKNAADFSNLISDMIERDYSDSENK